MSRRIPATLRRLALVWAVSAAVGTAGLLAPVSPAAAASPPARAVAPAAAAADALAVRGQRLVAAARSQRGKPYRVGARGPSAFDCSGFTGYVYRTQRLNLPRTAQQQYRAARPVGRAAARPGDLVFWVHGRHAYHVGVYAGEGRVWHAPKPGDRVKLAAIWSPREVRFGRIGR